MRNDKSLFLVLSVLSLLGVACTAPRGDSPADAGPPSALGDGFRIKQLTPPLKGDPTISLAPNPLHPEPTSSGTLPMVTITGASFTTVDTFDETNDGKSIGNIYVQDCASQAPWSGIELYKATFQPPSLMLSPGDVIDMTAQYQDYAYSGFPSGQSSPELNEPIVTFVFEYKPPVPVVIDVNDLFVTTMDDFYKGEQWDGMLVTVQNVTLSAALAVDKGRVSGPITSDATNGPSIDNQLYDMPATAYPPGTVFSSVTGIVTYFYSYSISPRSPADLVTSFVPDGGTLPEAGAEGGKTPEAGSD
jgi:hypothetical protein